MMKISMRNLSAVVLTIFCAVSLSAEPRFVSAHNYLTPFRGGVLWTTMHVPEQMQFSDGTPAGTHVLAAETDSYLPVATCGSWAMFAARTPETGKEPWVTDGTVAGTMLLRDIMPGDGNSLPRAVCLDGVGLISAGQALWRTNGTPEGTVLVATFINELGPVPVRAGHRVFLASSYGGQARLWRSDGTAAGTVVVKDFATAANISGILAAGDNIYVVTGDTNGQQTLWFSDGTAAGTVPLRTAKEIDLHADFYGRLTYSWSDSAGVFQGFCTTDGTSAGSCFLPAGATLPYLLSMKPFAGRLYYNWDDLRSTDGTSELATGITGAETIFSNGAGRLFLHSNLNSFVGERRLQESDGTAAGTHSLRTHSVYDAAVSGGRLFIYESEGLSAVDLDVAPTGFSPSSVAVPGGQTVTITGRSFTGPVTIRVGGVNATIGTVTPTSISFTAPSLTAGFHDIDLTLGDGRRMTLEQPLIYTCTAPTAFISTPSAIVCPLQPKVLSGSGGARCSWSPSTGLDDPSSCTPTATISDTTTYTLVVYSADGCASTNNPSITLTKQGHPLIVGITPLVANPGTMMTVLGSGFQCVNAVTVQEPGKDWSRGVGFTIVNGGMLRFPNPGGTPRRLQMAAGTVYGPSVARSGLYQRSSRRDFDGGTVADVLWRNTATGQTSLWSMAYGYFQGDVIMTVPTSWSAVAIGDFSGDARSDVFWMNAATGETSIWLMKGALVATAVRSTTVPVGWKPIGSADFNGDGKDDLFWHNSTTGETSIWLMNGTTFTGLRSLTVPTTWAPVAFGDFNGDAKGDVFWRNPSTGETSIWLMNGGMPSTTVRSDTLGGAWSVAGSGDLDGDGKEDLFWWNSATGETLCWYLNGAVIRAKETRPVMAAGWKPVQVGYFDTDETADIFWHNTITGETLVWNMRPGTFVSSWYPMTVTDLNWKPVALP